MTVFFCLDRSRHGSGVALYVKDTCPVKPIFVSNYLFECIVVHFCWFLYFLFVLVVQTFQ